MFEKEVVCFDFRIIQQADGSQIIDDRVKTPIDLLTPEMQVEYMDVHNQLSKMERIKKKEQKEITYKQRFAKNLFWKLACFCRLV